jgi:glutamine amidotransferase
VIAVLDSGFGNLHSALNALRKIGAQAELVADPDTLVKADKVLFPGVGSWGAVMQRLADKGFTDAIRDVVASGKPYLGICMGLQVLLETSEEDEGRGLSIFEGSVVKFQTRKVPQIGWNRVESEDAGAVPADYFYFINSFHARPRDETLIAATATYMKEGFVAVLRRDNVLAVQFHPEKSAQAGLDLLRRWLQS